MGGRCRGEILGRDSSSPQMTNELDIGLRLGLKIVTVTFLYLLIYTSSNLLYVGHDAVPLAEEVGVGHEGPYTTAIPLGGLRQDIDVKG